MFLEIVEMTMLRSIEFLVSGRITRSSITYGDKCHVIWNVHNLEMSAEAKREVNARMKTDIERANADGSSSTVSIAGVFNFTSSEEDEEGAAAEVKNGNATGHDSDSKAAAGGTVAFITKTFLFLVILLKFHQFGREIRGTSGE